MDGDGDMDVLSASSRFFDNKIAWYEQRALDPLDPDIDGDGLLDGFEVLTAHTDATDPDSDNDGFPDGVELEAGSDPNDANSIPDQDLVLKIDIKPDSAYPFINPARDRLLPVVILGSETFDVKEIDFTTLVFGPAAAPPDELTGGSYTNVNHDGHLDFSAHFITAQTGIQVGDREACLWGKLLDGTTFAGCDAITVLPACGLGFELVFLLPPLMWLHRRRPRSLRRSSSHGFAYFRKT